MRGKRMPKELKEAQGTLRVGRDSDLTFDKQEAIPEPPDHFSERMTKHYYRLCHQLQGKGLLFKTDMELLKTYVSACEQVLKMEILLEGHDPLSVEYKNLHLLWDKSVKNMASLGGKFGFNPVDKSKVWVYSNDGDPLKEFLKELE